MRQIELPAFYCRNYEEVEEGEKKGIKVEEDEYVDKTTFIIPDTDRIRINPATVKGRTTIYFNNDESWQIDLDYESVRMLFKDALK